MDPESPPGLKRKIKRTDEMKKSTFLAPNAFFIFQPTRRHIPGSLQLLRRNI
jgi:hypothetical protein